MLHCKIEEFAADCYACWPGTLNVVKIGNDESSREKIIKLKADCLKFQNVIENLSMGLRNFHLVFMDEDELDITNENKGKSGKNEENCNNLHAQ